MEFWELPAWRIVEQVCRGESSVAEVVDAAIARMERLEPELNAVVTPMAASARTQAARLDSEYAAGREPGPLAGVPVLVKDNMCTEGVPTSCGSKMLAEWRPPYDATVVELLRSADAVVIGKTNMDEFAMGSSTENSAFGPTSNPHDTTRVPGGSSGGSAAGVAAGYVPLALGSDTGGSIRQPAAYCGIQGLKPTYGLVSRWGLVAFASSLDQIGPLARDVGDLALAMDVIAKPDARDATCRGMERPRYLDALEEDSLHGRRIGLVQEFEGYDVDPELKRSVAHTAGLCEKAGAELVSISLPRTITYGLASYYIIAPAEASSNLARYDGVRYGMRRDADSLIEQYYTTRREGFGPEVKRRILTGTYVLSSGYYDAYYLTAQKVRQVILAELEEAFRGVDAILMPTCPSLPVKKGELLDDPISMYMLDVFTLPVNLAGLPGLSLYSGMSEGGLPLGVQLVGSHWSEMTLLGIASVLQSSFGVPSITPKGGERA
ncbi:MAG: Asp-tRNA(Asn)/Glu-tRNA(Gln) amidotransferase subunit GatA [Synergistales bacterium]|nr:Asp-tRNA(Asn)/Glu-tRNA(Gln) amidotransferase subunit GatA [Synergistales bacterium]